MISNDDQKVEAEVNDSEDSSEEPLTEEASEDGSLTDVVMESDAALPDVDTITDPVPLQNLEKERDKYLEMLQHTRAEFENYQKRMRREIEGERRYSIMPMARDLLPVLDNIHRAVQASQASQDSEGLVEGITMVARQLEELLQRYEIVRIDAVGKPFDPNFHEAVGQYQVKDCPANEVLEEVERGYQLFERVVRPSKVIVAASDETSDDETSDDETPTSE